MNTKEEGAPYECATTCVNSAPSKTLIDCYRESDRLTCMVHVLRNVGYLDEEVRQILIRLAHTKPSEIERALREVGE